MSTNNPWKQFQSIIAPSPRWVGKIVLIEENTGEVTVEKRNGERLKVSSDANHELSDYVFIENGVVVGKAGKLPLVNIEVN
ncbi:hypothetical protein A134_23180 [Vibrio crassostreae 9CS106]|uniref:Uncharacterized protein n=1 Tax=Vibrio crassostreae 9CS106 TaxID=1191300 RepID=A0A1B1C3D2_9VIBR|nr:hypothetical protein A134_23180 [Vibrio crassostreae 9CS106]